MKRFFSLFFIAAMFLCAASEYGDLQVTASCEGFKIGNKFVDISTYSKVIACEPPWLTTRFYTPADPIKLENNGTSARIIQDGKFDDLAFKNYSVELTGETGVVSLDMELKRDIPTFMEYTLFSLPEYLLAGAEFVAVTDEGKSVSGKIPLTHSGKAVIDYFVKNAMSFKSVNNYGTFSFEVLEGPAFTVADRRGVPFEFKRCYWIGTEGDMTFGAPVKSVVKFSYALNDKLKIAKPLSSVPEGVVSGAKEILKSVNIDFPLLPLPKNISETRNFVTFENMKMEMVGVSLADELKLKKAGVRLFGKALEEMDNNDSALPLSPRPVLFISVSDEVELPHSEGYNLNISQDGVRIEAKTARGAFYALHTLRGLKQDSGNGRDDLTFSEATVRDYPDMDLRGIHAAQLDNYSLENYGAIIENIMAPMKMNHLLLECEFVAWDALSDVHVRNAMPKEDLIKLLQIAEDNFIEVTPLIQTLGHTPWLFFGGKNMDLCEDPDYPYAFFTSNPRLYPILETLFDEVTETFGRPRYFHIGTDEAFLFGKYPNRPETIAKGTKKAVGDFVMWCYNYCKRNEMQMMMWQDIFVTREESPENGSGGEPNFTAELRKDLPKDIIFTVWRYSGDYEEFKDLNALAQEGFPVIGASWYNPRNPENLTREALKNHAMGMLSTTWVYTSDDQSARPVTQPSNNWFAPPDAAFLHWFYQLSAYIRSGSSAWNVAPEMNVDIDADKIFCDLYEIAEKTESKRGFEVDLSKGANIVISDENNPFLAGTAYGLDMLPERIGKVGFKLMKRDGMSTAIALKSRRNPDFPESTGKIPLNLSASELYFLHTVIGDEPEKYDTVAEAVITYTDNSTAVYPIRYKYEVGIPEIPYNHYLSTGNSHTWIFHGKPLKIWYSTWVNPHPEKMISSIEIKGSATAYYLFGLSAAE